MTLSWCITIVLRYHLVYTISDICKPTTFKFVTIGQVITWSTKICSCLWQHKYNWHSQMEAWKLISLVPRHQPSKENWWPLMVQCLPDHHAESNVGRKHACFGQGHLTPHGDGRKWKGRHGSATGSSAFELSHCHIALGQCPWDSLAGMWDGYSSRVV